MSTSVLRTADAWWALTHRGAVRVDTAATTTAGLLADHDAVAAAAAGGDAVPVERLSLISPVTVPCRVVAQMTNFASHVTDAGGNPATVPLTFFRKASTPCGPAVVLLDPGELKRFTDLRLRLRVNGELRQDMTAADMIYSPLQALQALARFQRIDPGDLVLTGTPAGTALSAPRRPVGVLAELLPTPVKCRMFFRGQARNPKYLQDGDVIEASVATDDGAIDLGTQHTVVRYAQ